MKFLRLIKYPGAKSTILPEIRRVFSLSGSDVFVDVFGGSGTVSLNVSSPETVYNDISYEASNLFRILKNEGRRFRIVLELFLDTVRRRTGNDDPRRLNAFIHERGETTLNSLLDGPGDFTNAMISFFRMSTSFGGMGDTYGTRMEKSVFRNLEKRVSSLGEISARVSRWKIENVDFRELVRKYDSPNSFFYFDPPYPGKDWYDHNFGRKDFEDIKSILDGLEGDYLLTLDARDTWLQDIFGSPAFVESHVNRNAEQTRNPPKRKILFYTGVKGA